MAEELASGRKKKKNGEEVKQLERRRIEITNFLQRCSTTMNLLQSLSIKESRRKENCRAIPEGKEDENENEDDEDDNYNDTEKDKEENEDGDEDNDNENDDNEDVYASIKKTTLLLLSKSMASCLDIDGSDSNKKSNYGTENDGD